MTFLYIAGLGRSISSTFETVLRILEEQQFYAKLSKCEFGLTEKLYLGHIIGVDGVRVHEEKIKAIRD